MKNVVYNNVNYFTSHLQLYNYFDTYFFRLSASLIWFNGSKLYMIQIINHGVILFI